MTSWGLRAVVADETGLVKVVESTSAGGNPAVAKHREQDRAKVGPPSPLSPSSPPAHTCVCVCCSKRAAPPRE